MFGGLCFTLGGHMCCDVAGPDPVVRVGPKGCLGGRCPSRTGGRWTGRPLEGFVYVGPAGCQRHGDLPKWLRRALSFVGTLPAKKRR